MKLLFILLLGSFSFTNQPSSEINKIASEITSTVNEVVSDETVAEITVYGRNEGTTIKKVEKPDGTIETTTTIDCDNFWQETCYTIKDAAPVIGNHITISTPSLGDIASGELMSVNSTVLGPTRFQDKYVIEE